MSKNGAQYTRSDPIKMPGKTKSVLPGYKHTTSNSAPLRARTGSPVPVVQPSSSVIAESFFTGSPHEVAVARQRKNTVTLIEEELLKRASEIEKIEQEKAKAAALAKPSSGSEEGSEEDKNSIDELPLFELDDEAELAVEIAELKISTKKRSSATPY